VKHSPFSYGSPAPKRLRSGILLIIIIGVMALFSILVTFLSNDSGTTQVEPTLPPKVLVDIPTEPTVSNATAVPTVELPLSVDNTLADLTYQTIQKAYETSSTTDWMVYARSLINRHVVWQGQLLAMHTAEELWFAIDGPAQEEIPQTALHLLQAGQPITPGETVNFEGDISRIVVFNRQVLVHLRNGQLTAIP
jgi:hypothetical protein